MWRSIETDGLTEGVYGFRHRGPGFLVRGLSQVYAIQCLCRRQHSNVWLCFLLRRSHSLCSLHATDPLTGRRCTSRSWFGNAWCLWCLLCNRQTTTLFHILFTETGFHQWNKNPSQSVHCCTDSTVCIIYSSCRLMLMRLSSALTQINSGMFVISKTKSFIIMKLLY